MIADETEAIRAVQAIARGYFEREPIDRHPLFVRLASGALDPDAVRTIAVQMHHVVDHFPRFLAALAANIPDWRLRMAIVGNLHEEHGRMDPAAVHVETYLAFLRGLGLSREEVLAAKPSIPVIGYVRAVHDLCLHHDFAEGLGALGMIEDIVARVSPIVARAARTRVNGSIEHFAEHEVLDVTHADEIYELAARVHAEHADAVERGIAFGWYYHRRLYTDLLALVDGERP